MPSQDAENGNRVTTRGLDEASNEFVLFIDEAGDPGLRAIAPQDEGGASEWFMLGGVLMRRHHSANVVEWVRKLRYDIKATQGPDLHFRRLSAGKKIGACERVAKLPLRAFLVASHKRNMRGYDNPRAAKMGNADWFYNWCLRLLLERVTGMVAASCARRGLPIVPIRVVMADRGGHSYSQTAVYIHHLQKQARHGTGVLRRRQIVPDALDWNFLEAVPAHLSAGAQIADVVASSFFSAVRRPVDPANFAPAMRLEPIMAREGGEASNFGVTLFPPPWEVQIDSQFRDLFRFYGHVL